MSKESNPLGYIPLTNIHKFLVYVGTALMGASLFLEVKNFDISILREASFEVAITGILLWVVTELYNYVLNYLFITQDKRHGTMEDMIGWHWTYIGVYFTILLLGFLFVRATLFL